MEAAWAPRLRKLLKTCCVSAAIMGHNTALSETPARATREKVGPSNATKGPPSDSALGLLERVTFRLVGGWFVGGVCWFCFYRLSL